MMVAELTNFMVTRLVRKTQTPASSASSTISRGGILSREKTMPGTSHREMSRGFMEVRGLGIVNITTLFGLKSIRHNKRLDLIVTLIPAKDQEELDRLGLEREGLDVLGEKVLHVQLSVAPGRDIARLVEVAAMDYHLKDMGIDMAGEFNRRLMSNFQSSEN